MKIRYSLLFLILTGSLMALYAQNGEWRKVTTQSFSGINDIELVDSNNGFAVGSYGYVYNTTDGGMNWNEIYKDVNEVTLNSVEFINETTGFAGGVSGLLLKTTDSGSTWSNVSLAGGAEEVTTIHALNENQIYVLAETAGGSAVFYTSNGGSDWLEQVSIPTTAYSMHFGSSTNGIVVSKNTLNLFYTTDGINWQKSEQPTFGGFNYTRSDVRGVYMVNANVGYSVGWGSVIGMQPSLLYKTTDGGANWNYLTQSEDNRVYDNIYGVYFKNENEGLAVGGGGRGSVVLRTTDGGENWIPINNYCGSSLKNITGYGDVVMANGSSGLIIGSTDFGDTWNVLTPVPGTSLYDIEVAGDGIIYSAGYDGLMLKSTDSGESWKASYVNTGKVGPNVQDMQFLDENTGYAAHSYGLLSKTTDGGNTWNAIISDTTSPSTTQYGVCFVDENLGFAVGKLANNVDVIYKTTDGGNSWSSTLNLIVGTLRHVDFYNSNLGVAVGNDAKIVYTTDGGSTWNHSSFNSLPGSELPDIRKVEFLDSQNVIAVGTSAIFKSKNGGASWDNIEVTGLTETLTGLSFDDSLTGYTSGTKSGSERSVSIYKTTDGGESWANIADSEVFNPDETLYGVAVLNGNVWACGYYSNLFTNEEVTGIEDLTDKPEDFTLAKNYPNPFNPSTTIEFLNNQRGNVTLKVYDILGRELVTLVNEELSAGKHKIKFNGSNLSSGIYFYTITTGNNTITNKMILMK